MTKLAPCRECQRHIRVSESACPFCAEPNPGTRSAGRSALLTGVLASAATLGCESKAKPEPPPMPYGAPPPVMVSDAAPALATSDAAPAVDATAPDAGAPDAAAKKRKKKKKKLEAAKEERKVRPPPKMPYGAPPARNRLV